jgi:plasmid stabilization system protein ParE
MNGGDADADIALYEVRLSEAAEANVDGILLRLVRLSPSNAERWYSGLRDAPDSLKRLPYRCPVVEFASFDTTIRRLIYGSGAGRYHIFFAIFDSAGNERGVVSVLRAIHGAQDRSL